MDQASARATPLDAAAARLEAALEGLDAALEHAARADGAADDVHAEMQLLAADRARLAEELDGARERADAAERANAEALSRLDAAMDSVGRLLAEQEAGPGGGPGADG